MASSEYVFSFDGTIPASSSICSMGVARLSARVFEKNLNCESYCFICMAHVPCFVNSWLQNASLLESELSGTHNIGHRMSMSGISGLICERSSCSLEQKNGADAFQ
eukprot:Amastigsp_a508615_2438.p2 type:complete len:106 gc:universal Amastigsp_a508615_2438:500-817(+)